MPSHHMQGNPAFSFMTNQRVTSDFCAANIFWPVNLNFHVIKNARTTVFFALFKKALSRTMGQNPVLRLVNGCHRGQYPA